MNVVSGNAQTAPVNTLLPIPIRVQVLQSNGQPYANFLLDFVVTSGGGSVYGGAEVTDAHGYADERWTLGPRLGPQTLQARAVSATSGTENSYGNFAATGLPPNDVLVVGNNSTGIFIMNANGSGLKQVLRSGGQDYSPDLSPDHSHIVFFSTSRVADSVAVYLMNADGTNIHKIGPALAWSSGPPRWSPNDSLIVFAGQITGAPGVSPGIPGAHCCTPGIIAIDTAGNIFSAEFFEEDYAGPAAWTANGQGILYWCDAGCFGYNGLDLEPDQALLGNLNSWWDVNAFGASPDGQHIAFVGEPQSLSTGYPTPPNTLYIMNSDGTNVTPLTTALGLGNKLSYSPDGSLIAVDHGFINADGTGYQVVPGCPCSFAASFSSGAPAPAAVFLVRRHMQWFPLSQSEVLRLGHR
jgi:hypothetical protein